MTPELLQGLQEFLGERGFRVIQDADASLCVEGRALRFREGRLHIDPIWIWNDLDADLGRTDCLDLADPDFLEQLIACLRRDHFAFQGGNRA